MSQSLKTKNPIGPTSPMPFRGAVGIPVLGKIGDVKLSDVPVLEICNPGFRPTEYNVVIAPAEMPEKVGSIHIADETRERMSDAQQVGRIIRVSPVAFNYDRWPDGSAPPQVGDIVWFARYAGATFEGQDGRTYRIVKDKDISGIIEEATNAPA